MEFLTLNDSLEVASTGESNGRILVFRVRDGLDEWAQVGNARVLVIGGDGARVALRNLLSTHGRPTLGQLIPDGISSSVHTALRDYAGL